MNNQDTKSPASVPEEKQTGSEAAIEWSPKREWWFNGRDFLIQVKHHISQSSDREGPNLWNVYAFIYPKHPHFAKFQGETIFQDAASEMPFHWNASYCRAHYDAKGAVTAYQVGSDYDHLHDAYYRQSEPEDGKPDSRVLRDAEDLIRWLTIRQAAEVQP